MTTPLIIGDVVQTKAYCTFGVQASVTSFYFFVQAPGFSIGPTDQDFLGVWDALAAPQFKAVLGAAVTYNGSQAVILSRTTQPIVVSDTSRTGVGTVAGGLLPLQTRGFWSRRTAFAGRAFRGRVYVPFPAQNDNTGGVPSAAYLTKLATMAAAIEPFAGIPVVASGGTATLVPCIFHRARPGPPPVAAFNTVILSRQFPAKWATQRRSGSFGRPNTSPI